jgi:hypothetical protein
MSPDQVFEIFNHTLSSKDSTEIMALATSIECFSSPTMGSNKIVIGDAAPEAFRTALTKFLKQKDMPKISVIFKGGDNRNAVYIVDVTAKKSKEKRALAIGIRGSNLVFFVENDCA